MNLISLSFKNVIDKPLSSMLSVLLFGFGVAIITIILLANAFLKKEISENAKGIDLVVGAKGSPLQIILSSVFHIDFPTGNIALEDANSLVKNRLVASAIPLSLGDSYRGYRIVGTTKDYPKLYDADVSAGKWFDGPMQITIGAQVAQLMQLSLGDKIASAHGLSEGGSEHEDHPFEVVGILKPTGKVIDQLILCDIESIWKVHGHDEPHEHDDGHDLHEKIKLEKLGLEVTKEQLMEEDITSLLITYRSPMAAVQLPRIVNGTSNLQAASPPYETARLFNIIGVGVEVLNILGAAIIIISAISVFIALINSLKERKYELAIIRSMGASRWKVFFLILLEGLLLTLFGSFFGFFLAHGGFYLLGVSLEPMSSNGLLFVSEEYLVMFSSLLVGIFASIIPAIMAYQADISETLAKG